jgi:hypothetical protein
MLHLDLEDNRCDELLERVGAVKRGPTKPR